MSNIARELEAMSTTNEITDSVYAELLARSLPRPIRAETERARFAETLLALDEPTNAMTCHPRRKHSPKC